MSLLASFRQIQVGALCVVALASVTRPEIAAAAGYGTLADCVRASGAVMYTASWCPVCRAQRKAFHGYANRLKTVECSVKKGNTRATCDNLNIKSYPTWIFADGSSVEGLLSVEALAERTGCARPD